jgi:hypothetical protein
MASGAGLHHKTIVERFRYCPVSIITHADYLHQHADCPAILSSERGKALLGRKLTSEEDSVRGTLVSGLTGKDFAFLDCFEGNVRILLSFVVYRCEGHVLTILEQQYARLEVLVHPLGPFTQIPVDDATAGAVEGSLIPTELPPLPAATKLAEAVPTQTYVWCRDVRGLDNELWSYEEFVRKNAWMWIGRRSQVVRVGKFTERGSEKAQRRDRRVYRDNL